MSDYRTDACRSCDQQVIWAVTPKGKAMPVDAERKPGGNLRLTPRGESQVPLVEIAGQGAGTYVSHFATCPQGPDWRKRRSR